MYTRKPNKVVYTHHIEYVFLCFRQELSPGHRTAMYTRQCVRACVCMYGCVYAAAHTYVHNTLVLRG